MTASIKAIQTRYKGHLFRSRLEARWAVVLDALGVKWHYEAEGYDLGADLGYYLPDFWLPELNTFLEIKAESPNEQEWQKLATLSDSKKTHGSFGLSLSENIKSLHTRSFEPDCLSDRPEQLLPWPAAIRLDSQSGVVVKPVKTHLDGEMYCPICGGYVRDNTEYVHFENPEVDDDYPHWAVRYRGPIASFQMYGELCYHKWELVVSFHKGCSYLNYAYKYEENFSPLQFLLHIKDGGWPGRDAFEAGRTARFEHGANGAVL